MRDVHRSIAAGASKRRHGYAGKWLTPSDAFVLARAASDDVGAAVHFRLRLVRVASIKGRENLVTVAVSQDAGAVNVFLVARRHAQRRASCRHLIEHLLTLHVLGGPDGLQISSRSKAGNVDAHQRAKNEVRHVGCGALLLHLLSAGHAGRKGQ